MIKLPDIQGEYRFNYNISHLTWFRVGGCAEYFFKPFDVLDLVSFLIQNNNSLPVTLVGAGSNLIIRDGGIDGVVIKLGQNFTNISLVNDELHVGAGCLNFNLAKFCLNQSISGFEFLIGIPGTIGGGVIMNAGAYGREFKDIVVAIEVVTSRGEILILSSKEIGFRYRGNNFPEDFIVTKVIFKVVAGDQKVIHILMKEIKEKRSISQPIKERTGGSTFANSHIENRISYKAWELIDKAGLRGYRFGGAGISELHCNFMINYGNATAFDLESLGEFVRAKVLEDSGISLEWEIKRIGKNA